jgi:hypothetical protein
MEFAALVESADFLQLHRAVINSDDANSGALPSPQAVVDGLMKRLDRY